MFRVQIVSSVWFLYRTSGFHALGAECVDFDCIPVVDGHEHFRISVAIDVRLHDPADRLTGTLVTDGHFLVRPVSRMFRVRLQVVRSPIIRPRHQDPRFCRSTVHGNAETLYLWYIVMWVIKLLPYYHVCSGSVVVTAYDFESARPGSNPEWGPIYYEASITAQGLPEPSSLRDSTLGTRAAEHKGCNWGMQVDWWLQPCAVFGHRFSNFSWHMPHK